MNIRRAVRRILNKKGDALIMAIVTMTVLVLLGIAVITVSMGTLRSNRADAATNDAYYAAESGVSNGLDQLRQEVSRYYAQMMKAESASYTGLFNNFASDIAANTQTNYAEPNFSGGTTNTTFSVAGHDSSEDVYEFLVSTVSTMADGTRYKVEGRLKVKRVDVSVKSWFIKDAALVVGGTLDLGTTCGMTVNGGSAILGALKYIRDWDPCQVNGGQRIIDPLIKDQIHDVLNYPGYITPAISNPNPYITTNNTVLNWNTAFTDPVRIDTAKDINVEIRQTAVPDGIIRVRGDLKIHDVPNVKSDIYCDGNFTANSCTLSGDIYVRGNMVINNGTFTNNVYCDGDITLYSGSLIGNVYCNGKITISNASSIGSMFATESISIGSAGSTDGIIYSKSNVTLGNNSVAGIVFSGGDINVKGSGNLSGALFAKKNVNYADGNTWYTINYDAAYVEGILNDPDNAFFKGKSGSAALTPTNVFREQSITAIGRIN
jgi:Tfp pilus assembly protein PilX